MEDFGDPGIITLFQAIQSTVPLFWDITLFAIWFFGAGTSYFAILKTTGKKRFWHSLTAFSFVCFLASLLITGMNTTTTIFLSGYWVGFYIMMTLASWYMLSNYK